MRKTVLMLINGFGVERKGSASVYSPQIMPYFDALIKEQLFGNLVATAGDYNSAYKNFSMLDTNKSQEDEIDNLIFEKKLGDNEILKTAGSLQTEESSLHLFYSFETTDKYNQVREILKFLNPDKKKKIFLHLILTSTSTATYDAIKKMISKISFEITEYCKIGMVVGRNKINTDDMLRAFYRELGEHWAESEKKLSILQKEVVAPENAPVFIINSGFSLKEGDTVIFMNYENVQMDKFVDDFTRIKVQTYSLYPFRDDIPHMFKKDEDNSSNFASLVEKHNIKILLLTTEDRINDINFYLNGMEKKKSPNITYAINDKGLFASKEAVTSLIDGNSYDGFIIDYTIANYTHMDEIKKELQSLDEVIKNISETSKEKDYTFIISSLFGIHIPVMDGAVQKVIDFSGKVPLLFQSNMFSKTEYTLNSGTPYSLALTFLTNINDDVKSNKLVHKLSKIEKVLSNKK